MACNLKTTFLLLLSLAFAVILLSPTEVSAEEEVQPSESKRESDKADIGNFHGNTLGNKYGHEYESKKGRGNGQKDGRDQEYDYGSFDDGRGYEEVHGQDEDNVDHEHYRKHDLKGRGTDA